ncbi:MAG: hypothetical protein QM528_04745 [Phycisphaerales bacterium]|nr:hypothetical protein [Phycisphaerales bacterium]
MKQKNLGLGCLLTRVESKRVRGAKAKGIKKTDGYTGCNDFMGDCDYNGCHDSCEHGCC